MPGGQGPKALRMRRRFFDEISQDTGKYVFGVADTLQCLEMGAVEILIVWENLEVGCAEHMPVV